MYISVVGCNYGDEGKGLAIDYLSQKSNNPLVVRHNGGAQSGHTVELGDKRFVFHELSSGSFRGADTYWASTFYPDLYKLGDEYESFSALTGIKPKIISSPNAPITTIDDVLINMLLEESRGDDRHGSCGMGINEADLRSRAGYKITIGELENEEKLLSRLLEIRNAYTVKRLKELGIDDKTENEYHAMLHNIAVLENFSHGVINNLPLVRIEADTSALFDSYSDVLFETGQGLLLDCECAKSMPNVTASKTGITNAVKLLSSCGKKLDRVLYVTRSYVTKHGAGKLDNECKLDGIEADKTNVNNEWQGSIRYAKFGSVSELINNVLDDLAQCDYTINASLLITHLNESDGKLIIKDGDIPVTSLINGDAFRSAFDTVYLSSSHFSADIVTANDNK